MKYEITYTYKGKSDYYATRDNVTLDGNSLAEILQNFADYCRILGRLVYVDGIESITLVGD